jgi:hypothetical protein
MWTAEFAANARREGWDLMDTIDNGKREVYLMVAAVGPRFKDHHTAGLHVVHFARKNSPLHRTALSAIVHSRAQQPQPRKKR